MLMGQSAGLMTGRQGDQQAAVAQSLAGLLQGPWARADDLRHVFSCNRDPPAASAPVRTSFSLGLKAHCVLANSAGKPALAATGVLNWRTSHTCSGRLCAQQFVQKWHVR